MVQEIFRCPYCDKLHDDQCARCCDEVGHVVQVPADEIAADRDGEFELFNENFHAYRWP